MSSLGPALRPCRRDGGGRRRSQRHDRDQQLIDRVARAQRQDQVFIVVRHVAHRDTALAADWRARQHRLVIAPAHALAIGGVGYLVQAAPGQVIAVGLAQPRAAQATAVLPATLHVHHQQPADDPAQGQRVHVLPRGPWPRPRCRPPPVEEAQQIGMGGGRGAGNGRHAVCQVYPAPVAAAKGPGVAAGRHGGSAEAGGPRHSGGMGPRNQRGVTERVLRHGEGSRRTRLDAERVSGVTRFAPLQSLTC